MKRNETEDPKSEKAKLNLFFACVGVYSLAMTPSLTQIPVQKQQA